MRSALANTRTWLIMQPHALSRALSALRQAVLKSEDVFIVLGLVPSVLLRAYPHELRRRCGLSQSLPDCYGTI